MATTAPFAVATSPAPGATRARPRAVAAWLFAVAAIVFTMIVVGGITRLTESGLSIVRWDPVGGIVPPLSPGDWAREYAAYRTSPQGILVNAGMPLAAFKGIFFWEYLHRVIARVFVIALVLPMAWFAVRRQVPAGYGRRLLVLLGLGALEPVVGWWMVASGLDKVPAVAPERLATHLSIALTILSVALWTALDLSRDGAATGAAMFHRGAVPGAAAVPRPTLWIVPFFALLAVQIVWGAFTAGLRAGHAADTWPLMLGHLVPPLGNLTSDPLSVQFVHRTLAYAVAIAALSVAFVTFRAGAGRRSAALASLVVLQFTLGVLTIVHGVPVPLAAAHQACAALLLAAAVWTAHWARATSAVS
jgi:cytochrome c oxidase assembly protein subunit 15